jgi:hypothetical protein
MCFLDCKSGKLLTIVSAKSLNADPSSANLKVKFRLYWLSMAQARSYFAIRLRRLVKRRYRTALQVHPLDQMIDVVDPFLQLRMRREVV